jgi:hypothetical protein
MFGTHALGQRGKSRYGENGEHLPTALYPMNSPYFLEAAYDKGCCLGTKENHLIAIFTTVKTTTASSTDKRRTWTKYEYNPCRVPNWELVILESKLAPSEAAQ